MSDIKEYTFQTLIGAQVDFEKNGKTKKVRITGIKIPKIQRDYAQGRTSKDVTKIRNNFLSSIYKTIEEKSHLTLDFIYGDIEEDKDFEEKDDSSSDEKKYCLIPLDGQQRLTTLFLLHWYAAKKEIPQDKEKYEFLKSFSYETRVSSRDFCKKLVDDFNPDFENLLKTEKAGNTEDSLSETIRNQPWFLFDWKNDPTINSMLVMLDAIHSMFKNSNGLWDAVRTCVGFYFLPLSEMGLSDELYIKMNSRGKPLTPFEHFKADFEKMIKETSSELESYFNHHFDVEWADVFFPYRGENNIIDDEMLRFFKFASSILCYEQELPYSDDEYELANTLYGEKNPRKKENIEYLKLCFDCLKNVPDLKDFFDKNFTKSGYEPGKVTLFYNQDLFQDCCNLFGDYSGKNRKFPLNEYILFYGVLIFLQNKNSLTLDEFKFRIRIIRNLVWNSSDEIRDDRPQRMKNILEETKNVILNGKISQSEKNKVNFNSRQKEEEIKKISFFKNEKDEKLKNNLLRLESNYLLQGCIEIVGLENRDNFARFCTLFENPKKSYDAINRALLSIGDYSQFISWRYQIGSENDSSWHNLFHPSEQRQGFEKTKKILNSLLEKNLFDASSLNDFADSYIKNPAVQKDWRYYLIKYDSMRSGKFGMYYWKSKNKKEKPYELIMMNTEKSTNGYNWEIFSRCLQQKFPKNLSLGNYASYGNLLLLKGKNITVEVLNSEIVLKNDDKTVEQIPVPQDKDGIDETDRVELLEAKLKTYF